MAINAFVVNYGGSDTPPTPVDPVVTVSPDPLDGPIPSDQVLTVTVTFNQTPTEVVLEYVGAPDEPSLDDARAEVVYGKPDGFRGGYIDSELAISGGGLVYTFSLVRSGGWSVGAMRFRAFAADQLGGSTT